MLRLQFWSLGNEEYLFIVITFRPSLTQICSACLGQTEMFNAVKLEQDKFCLKFHDEYFFLLFHEL